MKKEDLHKEITDMTIKMNCYNCGIKLTIPFKFNKVEYVSCPNCQKNIRIGFRNNTLDIDQLNGIRGNVKFFC